MMTSDLPIDLRSDTSTLPTPEMREAMANAEVGDDMLGEDPTVNRLEELVAERLGKEAAMFVPSGTQANQIGIRMHCRPGDELLIEQRSHIVNYEAGAAAALSGIMCRTLQGRRGMLDVDDLEGKIHGDDQHLSRTRLVCIENTTNIAGGRVWPLEQLHRVGRWCREHDIRLHLDGARLMNACVAGDYSPAEAARYADTVSICLSKGLGAPVGSVLAADSRTIQKARRARKLFGGAMRQAGIVAAGGLYAMQHHVDRLAIDHQHARELAIGLGNCQFLDVDLDGVETNLVFADVDRVWGTAAELQSVLEEHRVLLYALGPQRIRLCTHLGVTSEHIPRTLDIIEQVLAAPHDREERRRRDGSSREPRRGEASTW